MAHFFSLFTLMISKMPQEILHHCHMQMKTMLFFTQQKLLRFYQKFSLLKNNSDICIFYCLAIKGIQTHKMYEHYDRKAGRTQTWGAPLFSYLPDIYKCSVQQDAQTSDDILWYIQSVKKLFAHLSLLHVLYPSIFCFLT